MDAASTLGLVLILGTMLPAKSLGNEALQTCKAIFETLESGSPLQELVGFCPRGSKVTIEARNGRFAVKDLKPFFKKLGLNFSRTAQGLEIVLVCCCHVHNNKVMRKQTAVNPQSSYQKENVRNLQTIGLPGLPRKFRRPRPM